ncbi:MAG: hypothetical protein L6R43_06260, partial [Planctomycetes bacterium]|nr:hypothetical protein [Planctomycetota bacterium]
RFEALQDVPLSGPGSYTRRRARLSALASEVLALPAAKDAAGIDLYRLAVLAFEGGREAEAADFAARYAAGRGEGKEPLPEEGLARALRVRALAGLRRFGEAEEALGAWRAALPGAEGIPAVLKVLGDAYALEGRVEEAVARYREALEKAPRPLPPTAVSTVQVLVEALTALGRPGEAAKVLDGAAEEGAASGEAFLRRLQAVRRRFDLVGKPFPVPKFEVWVGMPRPEPEALRGKVACWHLFAWWMEIRLDELSRWSAFAAEREGKGLFLLPATRMAGYDPKSGRFLKERKEPEEAADIEAVVRARGWKGPFAASRPAGRAFDDLGVRGLPMDVVVGRDGLVRFVQAGEEPGGVLARLAAERALAEPAPAAPAAPAATPPPPPPVKDGGNGGSPGSEPPR